MISGRRMVVCGGFRKVSYIYQDCIFWQPEPRRPYWSSIFTIEYQSLQSSIQQFLNPISKYCQHLEGALRHVRRGALTKFWMLGCVNQCCWDICTRGRYFHSAWRPATPWNAIVLFGGTGSSSANAELTAEVVQREGYIDHICICKRLEAQEQKRDSLLRTDVFQNSFHVTQFCDILI